MTSQTNQFQHRFTEMVVENMDFSSAQWCTIADGMDRLPNACAESIGAEHFVMGARVERLEQHRNGRIAIYHTRSRQPEVDAMFFPGQFSMLFNVARQPERQMYFAGEHLSVHHTWVVGALDSALFACQ
jgi:monoamine oxidase